MASTVRTILEDALATVGILASGESMEAPQAAQALRVFNRMMAEWNQIGAFVYSVNRQTFALTPGQQTYTIGPDGNFNVPRPAVIDMVSVLINTGQPLEIPVHIYTEEEWRNVPVKSIRSAWPTDVYIQGDMPLNHLTFWPLPASPCSVILTTWQRTVAFTSLSDELVFPDGYERAIVYNLAIELAPLYDREPSNTVVQIAMESRRTLEDANWEIPVTTPTFATGPRGGTMFVRSRGYVME